MTAVPPCATCGEALEAGCLVCPACLSSVASVCAGCAQPVKSTWRLCPRCQTPLTPSSQPAAEQAAREAAEAEAARQAAAEQREREREAVRIRKGWDRLDPLGLGASEFVEVPPGEFVMGDGKDPDCPPHRVVISRAFLLQRTPVTQAQWEAVMGSNPSHFTGDPRRPVDTVSWDDAQEFIMRLNQQVSSGGSFRLPTEAEWEYACRAGTTGDFNVPGEPVEALGWIDTNSQGSTWPVARKLPNAWGLYDMHGNVWELVQDWYHADYYARARGTDPPGPASGNSRVLRGGLWFYSAYSARSASRYYFGLPSYRNNFNGFRLARTL